MSDTVIFKREFLMRDRVTKRTIDVIQSGGTYWRRDYMDDVSKAFVMEVEPVMEGGKQVVFDSIPQFRGKAS